MTEPSDMPIGRLETRAVHAGMEGLAEAGSHVPPIDLSTTNPLPSVEAGGDSYENLATGGTLGPGDSAVYQRLWQPGVARFERALADLEGTEESVAFATGMAALSACLMAAVAAKTPHIVAVRPLYGGTDHVLDTGLLGTSVTWAPADAIGRAIRDDTGLVVLETPANPTLELVDIADAVRQAGSVPVLVDNTFASPVLQRPAEHGARLVLHSATKYLGGHGDVMGGVVATDDEWATRLRSLRALTGGLLHPFAAYLLHRGLRTLPIRVRAQQETAGELARRLQHHPAVQRVMYPGLPGQDPLGLLGRQLEGPGSLISIDLGDYDSAVRFTQGCRLVSHAVSLGGVDSLVQHPASLTHRPVASDAKPHAGVVRLSIGLEHVDDLTADLMAALDAATAGPRPATPEALAR
ncbi:PLP-dependent transferase [Humibacter ginsenosidimutans]|uniref:homocysteine desulfhydrase n=2 Tax=Humibacter ginsenosidimutans TaxID=2599293 RepID=A0A5B8M1N5_9MICO|nr:PLP-dependent transferase [Humibacter ginsenosidimutans]